MTVSNSWIGLAGVARDERPRARRWGTWFEAPMLLLAVWIVIEWYLTANGAYPEAWAAATDRVIWLFFAIETAWLSYLVRDKSRYLRTNWVNLLVILLGIPVFWNNSLYVGVLRSLRLLLLLGLLFEMSSTLRHALARNNLGLTLLISFIIIVMAGIAIAAIDPAIGTPWDGIWWAWVTVSTVGYGDLVPETPQGRIFGGFLMVLGLGLFSLITATFSAFLISQEDEEIVTREEKIIQKEEEIISKERRVATEEERILQRLARMEDRLESLEHNLGRLIERLPSRTGTDESGPDDNPSD